MRDKSYGQSQKASVFDRFGVYLSERRIARELRGGEYLLDLGAGFNMTHAAGQLGRYEQITAVDVSLNPDIYPQIEKIVGSLESVTPTLQDNQYDGIILNSVLEHVKEPQELLAECRRLLAQDGTFYLSVPTWRGKFFLEYTAFKLKLPQARYEMNDHKMYYNKHTLWPMLVKAGFLPENIRLSYYKFGLNLLAICRN